MHQAFSQKFTDSFSNTVVSEVKRLLEKQPRVTRKEILTSFQEVDHPAIQLYLTDLLKDPESIFDQEKGPGGGIGYKGAGKTSGTIHINVTEEQKQLVMEKAKEILSMGGVKGFSPVVMASQMGSFNVDGISLATAVLSTLAAEGKLENRKGVGYCYPKPPAALPRTPPGK